MEFKNGTELAKFITDDVNSSIDHLSIVIIEALTKKNILVEPILQNLALIKNVGRNTVMDAKILNLPVAFKITTKNSHKGNHALLGKGVMYDTGGLDLKTGRGMYGMHTDKAGAAAVFGYFYDNPNTAATGYVGFVFNLIGIDSVRPGQIVKSNLGKRVQITNTDAEGRLVLADLAELVQKNKKIKHVTTIATLTGSMVQVMGALKAGLITNNTKLLLKTIANHERLKLWPFPLLEKELGDDGHKTFRKDADISNMNYERKHKMDYLQAPLFIKQFMGNKTYNHLDIAGMAADGHWNATGYGIDQLKFVVDNS